MPLRSGPDFILRDGFLAPLKALKDVSRLAKMFIDIKSPRGLFFTLKIQLVKNFPFSLYYDPILQFL